MSFYSSDAGSEIAVIPEINFNVTYYRYPRFSDFEEVILCVLQEKIINKNNKNQRQYSAAGRKQPLIRLLI
jgi:hypothetical protein